MLWEIQSDVSRTSHLSCVWSGSRARAALEWIFRHRGCLGVSFSLILFYLSFFSSSSPAATAAGVYTWLSLSLALTFLLLFNLRALASLSFPKHFCGRLPASCSRNFNDAGTTKLKLIVIKAAYTGYRAGRDNIGDRLAKLPATGCGRDKETRESIRVARGSSIGNEFRALCDVRRGGGRVYERSSISSRGKKIAGFSQVDEEFVHRRDMRWLYI